MWNVLIADDENKICKLIQHLIPWEELGLHLVATVGNGIDAQEIIKQERVDILISDARMPECDGIELIKWCHQQGVKMKYLVISGYRHFEYAHDAIQYGVDGYLLKPINREELVTSLRHVIAKLEQEKSYGQNMHTIHQERTLNRDRLRRHFIHSYIFDGNELCTRDIDSREYINEEYQMSFEEGIYQALMIKVDNYEKYKLDKLLARIQRDTEEMLEEFLTESVGCAVHSGIVYFMNYAQEKEEGLAGKLQELYEKLLRATEIFEGLEITFGLSRKEYGIQGLSRCLVTAGDAIKYRLYLPHVPIIYSENYEYETLPTDAVWTKERSELLENHIRIGNEKGIQKILFDTRLEIHQRKKLSPTVIYDVVRTVMLDAAGIYRREMPDSPALHQILERMETDVDNSNTVDRIWKNLERAVMEILELMREEMKRQEIQPIRIVRQYVDEHYMEDISLDDVAEQVKLSKNYISTVFKKETGVNFSDYLTAKRVDEAADLLRKTNLSIAEVANRVGYNDVKYFSKLCKKKLGMKPSEYRKLYS